MRKSLEKPSNRRTVRKLRLCLEGYDEGSFSMKNENEFVSDGKRYIKEIKKVVCKEKHGKEYLLECKIIERGNHEYVYTPDTDFLKKRFGEKGVFLSDSAKQTLGKAIDAMEARIALHRAEMTEADENETYFLSYRQEPDGYDCCLSIRRSEENYYWLCWKDFGVLVWLLDRIFDHNTESSAETVVDALITGAAKRYGDEKNALALEIYRRRATANECKTFSAKIRKPVLSPLPEEFDRNYVVDVAGIDVGLLERSGYRILHRPYFAMMKSTHEKWQLNPHTKVGVDAALTEQQAISFKDFLRLFEQRDMPSLHDCSDHATLARADNKV